MIKVIWKLSSLKIFIYLHKHYTSTDSKRGVSILNVIGFGNQSKKISFQLHCSLNFRSLRMDNKLLRSLSKYIFFLHFPLKFKKAITCI